MLCCLLADLHLVVVNSVGVILGYVWFLFFLILLAFTGSLI